MGRREENSLFQITKTMASDHTRNSSDGWVCHKQLPGEAHKDVWGEGGGGSLHSVPGAKPSPFTEPGNLTSAQSSTSA